MTTGAPSKEDSPKSLLDLFPVWLEWMQKLMRENHLPLSGNVKQWIEAWGEAVGQVGVFNVNIANSANPQMEKTIVSRYSYGRQIGRILDMLEPLVQKDKEFLVNEVGTEKVREFECMVAELKKVKGENGKS